jgi:alpha-L-rhamnosidase
MLNKLVLISSLFVIFTGCKVKIPAVRESNLFSGSEWITGHGLETIPDSLSFLDHPAPCFRKSFRIAGDVQKAELYITAAGYYVAALNGEKIGDIFLTPSWTNYSKRIYYDTYDLTPGVKKGLNCITVELGNGFYNLLPMLFWGNLNLRQYLPVGAPSFIAKLVIEYRNGKRSVINSDQSWRSNEGPVTRNNVYRGEYYDSRKEITGWDTPEFNDKNWKQASLAKNPGGDLQPVFFPPVRAFGRITPVQITEPEKGVYIFDLGKNFTGLFEARVKGNPGDSVFFTFGERLYNDGKINPMTAVAGQIKRNKQYLNLGATRVSKQQHCYVIGEKGEGIYTPKFSFHTYRYAEVRGLKYKPEKQDFTGLLMHSDIGSSGEFSSSSGLINNIQEITKRTFMANLLHVQSDCAGREKFGYGGDLAVTSESFICNYNMHDFYRKTINDWLDAMNDSVFIDTAPYVGIKNCGLSWEFAFLLTQYNLLVYYGDTALIKKLYSSDLQWMEKVKRIHPSGFVDRDLGDHESLGIKATKLIGTANYYESARIMERFSGLMNDKINEQKFGILAGHLRRIILDNFWKKPVGFNKQTLYSTLLYHDLLPAQDRPKAIDSLLLSVRDGINGHFTTGIFGTKYIMESLSRNGYSDKVFQIVNSTDFPGWGYMIDKGATTLWETWKESDDVYSNCHPMFGSVTEWFYRWLGGIRPDKEIPGFRRFILGPNFPEGLNKVNCSYNAPNGKIISQWSRERNLIKLHVVVPKESEAILQLPAGGITKISRNNRDYNLKNNKLDSGDYQISFILAESK